MPVELVFKDIDNQNRLTIQPEKYFVSIIIEEDDIQASVNLDPDDITELIEELKVAKAHAEEG